jgi:site-specific recombinase XerD
MDCEKHFKLAKERASIDPAVIFRDLRHTAASWQLENGANLETIRRFLGHADITTTARYLHVDDKDVERMAERTLGMLR